MKRPLQHIMESESETLLRSLLPSEWIIRPIFHDYGVDYEIEIVDQHSVSGNRIWIQLKSVYKQNLKTKKYKLDETDKNILNDNSDFLNIGFLPFSISTKELSYATKCAFPLLLFVADLNSKEIFWIPIRDEIIGSLAYRVPKWRSQKTSTLHIPEWNKISWEKTNNFPGLRWYALEPARMYAFAIIHYFHHEYQYTGRLSGYVVGEGFIDYGEEQELIDSLHLAKNYVSAALEQEVLFGSSGINYFTVFDDFIQLTPIAEQLKRAIKAVDDALDLLENEKYDYLSLGWRLGTVEHGINLLSTAISSYQGCRQKFLLTKSAAIVRSVQKKIGKEGPPNIPLKREHQDK